MVERSQAFTDGMRVRQRGLPATMSLCGYFGKDREDWFAGWAYADQTQRSNDDCDWPAPIREAVW